MSQLRSIMAALLSCCGPCDPFWPAGTLPAGGPARAADRARRACRGPGAARGDRAPPGRRLGAVADRRGPGGPHLAEVAAVWGVPPGEVAAIHSAIVHEVAFCGFGPGFAYLSGIGEQRAVPRRASPRTRVPAGSVALAGCYTGIYPWPSPGGWQLIGRTELAVWDPAREPPALLRPGCRVRFVDAGR